MSFSSEQRRDNCRLALTIMLEQLGDTVLELGRFEVASGVFETIYTTTWQELEERYFIKDKSVLSHRRYILTGSGWRKALDINWDIYRDGVEERLAVLAAALKAKVKGRHETGYLYPDEVATQTGLPRGWVCNAIEAKLLDYKFNMKGAKWYEGRSGSLIVVPTTFGHKPLGAI